MIQAAYMRTATLADAAELARLVSLLGHVTSAEGVVALWETWSAEGNSALVVPGEGRLLGMVTLSRRHVLHRPRPLGRITSLIVDPAARGRGLGRALVVAAEGALAQEGCGWVEVTSHARRKASHEFYRHLAYEQSSLRFVKELG